MKKKILFTKFNISNKQIAFEYVDDESKGNIYFKLFPAIIPSNDLIAHALSTLCARNNYEVVEFDLSISKESVDAISFFTQSKVRLTEGVDNLLSPPQKNIVKENIILNFSGGFDSLAAKLIMPSSKTKLVSMDFGGNFSREQRFFSQFDTCTVETNLLAFPIRKNSWSFMGIGSILFSEYLQADFYTFGGILEASRLNFDLNKTPRKNNSFPPFLAVGMENAPYTLGLTEIATAIIMLKEAPKLTLLSLQSVANDGEEKKYRKQLILYAVAQKLKMENFITSDAFVLPINKVNFGQNFALDFLSFYLIKYLDISWLFNIYHQIPEEVISLSHKLSLCFYEKFNSNFLSCLPQSLQKDLMMTLIGLEIPPYSEIDWIEFREVIDLLDKLNN